MNHCPDCFGIHCANIGVKPQLPCRLSTEIFGPNPTEQLLKLPHETCRNGETRQSDFLLTGYVFKQGDPERFVGAPSGLRLHLPEIATATFYYFGALVV